MRLSNCALCARSIGWLGLVVNIVLMVMKAFIGLIGGSQAMLADAMYSLKDAINSLMVIIGMTISRKPLDQEHPYGHGKVEFILSMLVSAVFILLTFYLMVHAIILLLDSEKHQSPHMIVLWAALVAVAVNVAMYFYSRCVAIETNSPIIRTLAKHHHGDATASGAVALGIIGAHYLDMPWIDTAIAVWETIDLLLLGRSIFMEAYRGLMDHSVGEAVRERLTEGALSVPGVLGVVQLRARYVGQDVWADMIIAVGSNETVDRAHDICERVKAEGCAKLRHIASFHVSAEAVEEWQEDTRRDNTPLHFEEVMLGEAEI